jgi:Flp pilus assembly pilin Flp
MIFIGLIEKAKSLLTESRLVRSKAGQTVAEYVLLLGMTGVVLVSVGLKFKDTILGGFYTLIGLALGG